MTRASAFRANQEWRSTSVQCFPARCWLKRLATALCELGPSHFNELGPGFCCDTTPTKYLEVSVTISTLAVTP